MVTGLLSRHCDLNHSEAMAWILINIPLDSMWVIHISALIDLTFA